MLLIWWESASGCFLWLYYASDSDTAQFYTSDSLETIWKRTNSLDIKQTTRFIHNMVCLVCFISDTVEGLDQRFSLFTQSGTTLDVKAKFMDTLNTDLIHFRLLIKCVHNIYSISWHCTDLYYSTFHILDLR